MMSFVMFVAGFANTKQDGSNNQMVIIIQYHSPGESQNPLKHE